MTLPSGRIVNYQRDTLRRLSALETTLNGQPVTVLSNLQYRADGQMTQCTFGNGVHDSRDYDLQSHLLRQTLTDSASTILDERTYDYDLNGNLQTRIHNGTLTDYDYDAEDRLLSETPPTPASQFDYDWLGNRQTRSGTQNETYTYQPQSNRLVLVETDTPQPTLDRTFQYNDANRLSQVLDSGQLSAEYTVNANGQRTHKTLINGTIPTTTVYHYGPGGQLIAETQSDGTLMREYLWANGLPVAQIDNRNGTETLTYLHTDHLMTPRVATDATGTVVWRWDSEAFGESAPDEDSDGNGLLTTINLRFPGQLYDSESGLHYNFHRDYDPQTGRYVQSDPIGLQGGINVYNYSGSNAINSTDPSGLRAIKNPWNAYQRFTAGVFKTRSEAAAAYRRLKASWRKNWEDSGHNDPLGNWGALPWGSINCFITPLISYIWKCPKVCPPAWSNACMECEPGYLPPFKTYNRFAASGCIR